MLTAVQGNLFVPSTPTDCRPAASLGGAVFTPSEQIYRNLVAMKLRFFATQDSDSLLLVSGSNLHLNVKLYAKAARTSGRL